MAFLRVRRDRIAAEFGMTPPSGPLPLLAWGEEPEYRPVTADGKPRILVGRHGPDWWRIRYQIAHEVFHWLCTPPGVLHWTHEFFGVEMATRAMVELGELNYAERSMAALSLEAERLPIEEMLTSPLVHPYPDGLYGRAWVTGRELIEAIGWVSLKPLARTFDDDGRPSVSAWMHTLTQEERASVVAVLGEPSPAWV